MVFSSLIFLFSFLPIILFGYFLLPWRLKNLFLLLASLFFYAWGEELYTLLMLWTVVCCYLVGLGLASLTGIARKMLLATGITITLVPLLYYKYSVFLGGNINKLLGSDFLPVPDQSLHLPLGISFFTFQAISYLIDTYKSTTPPQKNPINLGLYIALFPQLIAGPIVRYHDIAKQIVSRKIDSAGFFTGIERFIIGLAKKVLLANTFGRMADAIFSLPESEWTAITVWLGALSYTLQIYYDFSGYSDMAIGLGRMFGFTFLENFNYPYRARSIQDFWRRWHISLSNWFRDYLYIPLGGNRKGTFRTSANLFIVFLLCGFWHGASWNFIFWGMFHGLFLALERGRFGIFMRWLPPAIQHIYTLLVVLIGWIFFRADTFDTGLQMTRALFSPDHPWELSYYVVHLFDPLFIATFVTGILFAVPLIPYLKQKIRAFSGETSPLCINLRQLLYTCGLYIMLLISLASLATGAYNPFIYFRF